MRAREYPSGLIRIASKGIDAKGAPSSPGGRVHGNTVVIYVPILSMPQELLEG
jgi:hypothetical protein